MKTVYFLFRTSLVLLLLPFYSVAQESMEMPTSIFLFNQFTDGKILLTDQRSIETQFNYDCEKQELYYKEGNEYLMMYNTSNIDTLYVRYRKFIPASDGVRFLECIPAGDVLLLVDWKAKLRYKGKRGAMGVVTQSGGQASLDMELMRNNGISNPDNSVYKIDYKNSYQTYLNGSEVTFNNLKSFLNLFPNTQKKAVRQLIKRESIDFDNPWQVAKLVALLQTV